MTGNELYEEYCNEYPLIMGYREVSYESWLQRQVIELRENVVNKNCNIHDVSGSYSIKSETKDKIERGLINGKLEPIKCECGSTEFVDKTTDKIDYLEVEKDRFCKKCNKLVGYWSYGHWLP